jgi:predicted RNase H-like HicB family nuclease
MQTAKYVYWQDDDAWLGYLKEFPDYWTQGDSPEDLLAHLEDLYRDFTARLRHFLSYPHCRDSSTPG